MDDKYDNRQYRTLKEYPSLDDEEVYKRPKRRIYDINEIIDDVHQNENVAQMDYDEKRQEFDMVFYYDNLMTQLERRLYDTAKNMNIEYELDDVREVSYDLENSDEYDDMLINAINKHSDLGSEI